MSNNGDTKKKIPQASEERNKQRRSSKILKRKVGELAEECIKTTSNIIFFSSLTKGKEVSTTPIATETGNCRGVLSHEVVDSDGKKLTIKALILKLIEENAQNDPNFVKKAPKRSKRTDGSPVQKKRTKRKKGKEEVEDEEREANSFYSPEDEFEL